MSASSSNTTVVPNGNITIGGGATGSCTVDITPAANENGSSTITLTVNDGTNPDVSDTFVLTVNAQNDVPTISDVTDKSTNEDTAMTQASFTIGDVESTVLCNADVSATSSNTTLVPNGNITIGGGATTNCTVDITPAANQNGTATITLTVDDGVATTDHTFVLTVNAVNDPPTITNVTDKSTNEDTASGAINFTIADVDDTVTCSTLVSTSSSNVTLVPNGNIALSGGATQSCSVNITPAANQNGTSTITLIVNDGTNPDVSDTFVLTVNAVDDAPTISDVTDKSTNEDTAMAQASFTIGDIDSTVLCNADVTASSSNTTLVPNGNITIGGGATTSCTVDITPAASENGTATITLTVDDGTTTTDDTFILTVNAVNNAPTISDVTDKSTNEDTAMTQASFTIADSDDTVLCNADVTATSSNTTVVPNGNITIGGGATQSCTVDITPAANESGTSTITLTVNDGTNPDVSDTFVLTVNAQNDGPTISDVTDKSTNEDTAMTQASFTIGDIDNTVLCNADVTASSSNTTVVPNGNITIGGGATTNCTVDITPAANQNGTATITLTVDDGTTTTDDTFVLTVNSVNDAPTISDITNQSTSEDTAKTGIAFTIDDADHAVTCGADVTASSSNTTLVPNGNITINGAGTKSCSLDITPASNEAGTSTITVTVSDGTDNAQDTFVLTVNAVNDNPTISDVASTSTDEDTAMTQASFTIGDVDNTVLCNADVTASSSNTTVVPNGNITIGGGATQSCTVDITPAADQNGSATITLTVNDGTNSTNDVFTLTVNAINDAPVVSNVADSSTNQDTATGSIAFTISD
ncbi:cadherin-like domain-containing protein, partial [bacterium]|nr:cadherin-like domain-containing protein [bacterium]